MRSASRATRQSPPTSSRQASSSKCASCGPDSARIGPVACTKGRAAWCCSPWPAPQGKRSPARGARPQGEVAPRLDGLGVAILARQARRNVSGQGQADRRAYRARSTGAEQGHLQRRQIFGLSQQGVGTAQAHRVGRPGQRYAEFAMVGTPPVLDPHPRTGIDELDRAAQVELPCPSSQASRRTALTAAARSNSSKRARSMATQCTSSRGCSHAGSLLAALKTPSPPGPGQWR